MKTVKKKNKKDALIYNYSYLGGGFHAITKKNKEVFMWIHKFDDELKNLKFIEHILACLNVCEGFSEPIEDLEFLKAMASVGCDKAVGQLGKQEQKQYVKKRAGKRAGKRYL